LRLSRIVLVGVLGASMLLGACGGKGQSSSSSTTVPSGPGTSTTAATGPMAPLTGLPEGDAAKRDRPLLVVKVDNHPQARPQFGIDRADDIVEEKVEGGLSRFMALFHSQDADRVGPVRSLRSTDPEWLAPEGGMIAYSGGIDPVKALLPQAGITDLGADSHGPKYYKRRSDRPYEHSMYVSTPVLRELTPKGKAAPRPLYAYLGQGQHFDGSGAAPVTSVSGSMADGATATSFSWTWNPQSGTFLRGTDSAVHNIENVGQIAMKNVIIQFTDYRSTPWRDRANSPVDEAVTTGSGDAWILSDGKLVKGRWSRPGDKDITAFTDASGAELRVQPGHTWLMLVPTGRALDVH
jgi:hypothetical protein